MTILQNIRKLQLIQFIKSFHLGVAVFYLIINQYGLGQTELFIIQSLFAIIVVLGEVPTGFISDKYGRVISITIGLLLASLGYVIYGIGDSFWRFLGAEALLALGFCCVSGSDSALLHDTLVATDSESSFKKQSGKLAGFRSRSEALGGLLAGGVATMSLSLPFFIDGALGLIGASIAFTMIEPVREKFSRDESSLSQIKSIFAFVLSHRHIRLLLLFSACINTITISTVWFAQPFLTYHQISPIRFGVYAFISNMTIGWFGLIAHQIEKKLGPQKLMLLIIVLSIITALIIGRYPIIWVIPLFWIYQIVRGSARVIVDDELYLISRPEMKASIQSINSMGFRLSFAIWGPVCAWIGDTRGIGYGIMSVGVILGTICLIIYLIYYHQKQ